MNSWTNPQTILSLIVAATALVGAIVAGWHSIVTRNIATSANINAARARTIATTTALAVAKNPDKNN